MKNFKNVTQWRFAIFETVFWQFDQMWTFNKSFTKYTFGYLISVKHYGESLNIISRNQFLTWCCQSIDVTQWQSWIWKTVQNHNSGSNFFIWNGYEIYNMHKIMYDIGDDAKVKLENNGSHYACYVQKIKSHCVTWIFWKWQKN